MIVFLLVVAMSFGPALFYAAIVYWLGAAKPVGKYKKVYQRKYNRDVKQCSVGIKTHCILVKNSCYY